MARLIVCAAPFHNCKRKISTVKARWREYGAAPPFLYLLLIQKYELMPPSVTLRNVARILLKQAEDVDHVVAEFFQAYQHVCQVLGTPGYNFPGITVVEESLTEPFKVEPVSKDVEQAIKENYKTA